MLIAQFISLVILGRIAYEDLHSRMVHWILFPLLALIFAYSYYTRTSALIFVISVGINMLLMSAVLLILFLYTKTFLKIPFLNRGIGLGDILFFYALCLAFPTVSFMILFVFSLMFSMIVHFFIQKTSDRRAVPLAGYMSIFTGIVILIHLFIKQPALYIF